MRKLTWLLPFLAFSIALAQAPDERTFQQKLSAAIELYRDGKADQATAEFEALYRQNSRSSDVQAWLGFLYLKANKANAAIPLLEKAIAQQPKNLEIVTNLGNAYALAGRDDDALAKFNTAASLNTTLYEPHYNIGNIHLKRKNFALAVASFERASRLKPDEPFVQNNLGVSYEGLQKQESAANAFRRAADLRPENATFARNAGMTLMRLRRPAEAIPYLERAAKGLGDDRVSLALGEAYTQAGRSDLALPYYEGMKDTLAKSATFWFNLGVLRNQAGDPKGAEEAYRKALAISPNDLDTMNNLGLLVFRNGDFAEAMTLFDKLVGLNPSSKSARLSLAAAAARSGNWGKAIENWREHIKANGDDIPVRLDLANALWESGDYATARYHYLQVLSRDPNNYEAMNGMGLFHLRDSKFAQAEAAFRGSISAEKGFIPAYNNLAITLDKMNRRKEAIAILEQALKIAPDDAEVKANLQRLKTE